MLANGGNFGEVEASLDANLDADLEAGLATGRKYHVIRIWQKDLVDFLVF